MAAPMRRLLLIGIGDLWIATHSVRDLALAPIIVPLALIGIGFALGFPTLNIQATNGIEVSQAKTPRPMWLRKPVQWFERP